MFFVNQFVITKILYALFINLYIFQSFLNKFFIR